MAKKKKSSEESKGEGACSELSRQENYTDQIRSKNYRIGLNRNTKTMKKLRGRKQERSLPGREDLGWEEEESGESSEVKSTPEKDSRPA